MTLPPRHVGFFAAFSYPFRGLGYLAHRPTLWRYAALPFLVNLILYTALAVALYVFVQNILLGQWLTHTWTVVRWAAAILAYATGLALLAFSFTVMGNVVAAPLLDLLAERVLAELRKKPLPTGRGWFFEAALSIGRQLVKLVIFGAVQTLLFALWLLPGGALLHPVAATLVTILFLALEYFDYPLAADRIPLIERHRWTFRHSSASWGFGASLFILILLPLIGYVALPACVTGATLLYHDILISEISRD